MRKKEQEATDNARSALPDQPPQQQMCASDVKVFIGRLDVVRDVRESPRPEPPASQPQSRCFRANLRSALTIVPVHWSPLTASRETTGRTQIAGMLDDADFACSEGRPA